MAFRATMTVEEPTGRKFSIAGSGNTQAEAVAELTAKAKLTVGIADSATVSGPLATLPDLNDGPVFSDAVLVLRQTLTDKLVSIHLENISVNYGTGNLGKLNLADPDILAFALAYRDGAGEQGYTVYDGEFVA